MKSELIVALDVPSASAVPGVLSALSGNVDFFKVGLELFTAEGPSVLRTLEGRRVFLDLKLHDIPRTVERAVSAAGRHGVDMLTVHSSGGREMLKAAVAAAGSCDAPPKIVAVTALTSLNQSDLHDIGVVRSIADQVLALGEMAIEAGVHGLVCSPLEAERFRTRLGPAPILVTPGIRPAGADAGDQKRIATPELAVRAGASYLVVGRPILEAPDPQAAALEILRQMASA
jgi:orotidine-5'-phosphate decarboxylase